MLWYIQDTIGTPHDSSSICCYLSGFISSKKSRSLRSRDMLLLVSLSKPSGAPGTHVSGAGGQNSSIFLFWRRAPKKKIPNIKENCNSWDRLVSYFIWQPKFPDWRFFLGQNVITYGREPQCRETRIGNGLFYICIPHKKEYPVTFSPGFPSMV